MSARAGAVGHVNSVGNAFEAGGLAQQFLRIARDRWYQLRRHDEPPLAQAFLQRAGEGSFAALLVHQVLVAAARALICFAGVYQIYASIPAFLPRFLDRQAPAG